MDNLAGTLGDGENTNSLHLAILITLSTSFLLVHFLPPRSLSLLFTFLYIPLTQIGPSQPFYRRKRNQYRSLGGFGRTNVLIDKNTKFEFECFAFESSFLCCFSLVLDFWAQVRLYIKKIHVLLFAGVNMSDVIVIINVIVIICLFC